MKTIDKIRKISIATRKVCEQLSQSELAESMDFKDEPESLTAMCACASWILKNELRRHGIMASLVCGTFVDDNGCLCGGHCWVKWKDWYIDLTAKQFEWFFDHDKTFKPVEIFHRKTGKIAHYYQKHCVVRSVYVFNEWPLSQSPGFVIDKKVRQFIRDNMSMHLTFS